MLKMLFLERHSQVIHLDLLHKKLKKLFLVLLIPMMKDIRGLNMVNL